MLLLEPLVFREPQPAARLNWAKFKVAQFLPRKRVVKDDRGRPYSLRSRSQARRTIRPRRPEAHKAANAAKEKAEKTASNSSLTQPLSSAEPAPEELSPAEPAANEPTPASEPKSGPEALPEAPTDQQQVPFRIGAGTSAPSAALNS